MCVVASLIACSVKRVGNRQCPKRANGIPVECSDYGLAVDYELVLIHAIRVGIVSERIGIGRTKTYLRGQARRTVRGTGHRILTRARRHGVNSALPVRGITKHR